MTSGEVKPSRSKNSPTAGAQQKTQSTEGGGPQGQLGKLLVPPRLPCPSASDYTPDRSVLPKKEMHLACLDSFH